MSNENRTIGENLKRFYRSKVLRITLNVLGIFIAILGLVASAGLIYATNYFNSEVKTRTTAIEDNIVDALDRVETAIDVVSKIVLSISTPQEIAETVDAVIDNNVERLENLESTMRALNFGGRLDSSISRVEETIESLNDFNTSIERETFVKDIFKEKVAEIQAKIDDTRDRVTSNARRIRVITFYGTFAGTLLAIVFIIGELNLFKSCARNIRVHTKKPKPIGLES